jgi:CBS domain-containing protein
MRARDIMTADPEVVTKDEPVSKVAAMMRDREIGIIPVVDDLENKHLLGVITDRDIAVRCVASLHMPACHVEEHMTSGDLFTVAATDGVEQVVTRMEHDCVRRIPVVSDDNRLVGIISTADIARTLGRTQPLVVEHLLEAVSKRRK